MANVWKFKVPTADEQLEAIGIYPAKVSSVKQNERKMLCRFKEQYSKENPFTSNLQKFLDPEIPGFPNVFFPIARPEDSDWLNSHQETGQTFKSWINDGRNPVGLGRTVM
jgi:hypothetical protein